MPFAAAFHVVLLLLFVFFLPVLLSSALVFLLACQQRILKRSLVVCGSVVCFAVPAIGLLCVVRGAVQLPC